MSEVKQGTTSENGAADESTAGASSSRRLAAAAGVTTGILGAPAVVTAAAPKVIKMQTSWPSSDIWMDFARQYTDGWRRCRAVA